MATDDLEVVSEKAEAQEDGRRMERRSARGK